MVSAPYLRKAVRHLMSLYRVSGRRFRVSNIVDDFSRGIVDQLVSVSISGQQVARFLSQIIETRDWPDSIVCDNGTEFTSKAMFFWTKNKGVRLSFIQLGKPTQNAFVESLNGTGSALWTKHVTILSSGSVIKTRKDLTVH